MRKMSRWLDGLYADDLDVLFGVLAQEELVITQFDTSADSYAPLDLELTGTWTYDAPAPKRDPRTRPESAAKEQPVSADSTRDQRFDRVVRALTESAPEELGETRVALVGAGGLGSILAEQLARLGVGHLDIIDPDVVERSNLPRLYGAYESDLDRPKVTVLAEHCRAIDSSITVEAYETVAEEATDILMASDIIVAGLDRMASRAFLNEFCVKHCLPYVDAGVVITTEDGTLDAMEEFVQTVSPGATACLACLNRIDRERARIERLPEDEREIELERGYIAESDLAPEPAVVHLNTTIAGMAVSEVVNLVTGVDTPAGLIRFEALDNSLVSMGTAAARSEGCPVCGHNGVLAQGTADHSVVEIDEAELDLSFNEGADVASGAEADSGASSRTAERNGSAPSPSEGSGSELQSSARASANGAPTHGDENSSASTTPVSGANAPAEGTEDEGPEGHTKEDVHSGLDPASESEEDSDEGNDEDQISLPLPYYLSSDHKGVFPWNH
jgi:molybdopterin/thiamine biosynthesis adenylyltransferase